MTSGRSQLCWILAVPLVLLTTQCFAHPFFPTSITKKCMHTIVHKMKAADCRGLDLKTVPNYLNKDVEVLDLSYNRIKRLHKEDFSFYSNAKIVYLDENFVSKIENDTFSNLQYLEVLKLSENEFKAIPSELFHLQYLRKLTLDNNSIDPKSFEDIIDEPPMYNLQFLSISYNELQVLPPMQKFPYITFLNISGNYLETISPHQLAPACLLTNLDMRGNKHLFKTPGCDCIALKQWVAKRNIEVQPSFDTLCIPMRPDDEEACFNDIVEESNALYSSCMKAYIHREERLLTAKIWYWTLIVVGVIASIVVVCLCYRCAGLTAAAGERPIPLEQPLNNLAEVNRNLIVYDDGYAHDGGD